MARNSSKIVQTKTTEQNVYDVVFNTVNGDMYEVAVQLRLLNLALEGKDIDKEMLEEKLPILVTRMASKLEEAIERLNNLS